MSSTEPTQDELRLARTYQEVLSDVSRCAQAVREGDWKNLAVVAGDLSRNAVHLTVAAEEPREPGTPLRADVVVEALVRKDASPLTRVLHPAQAGSMAKTAMTDPFTHPGR